MGFLKKLFGDYSSKEIKRIRPKVDKVLSYEEEYSRLTDAELKAKTNEFRDRLNKGETLDDILPEAFAVCREASWRVLGMKHFPVQIMGGIVLHQGRIAEMKTGEEKVGKHCFNSGHFSGSRSRYILFKVEGCPRLTIDQAVRHEVGVMKNVESFRYVNQDSFVYEVPKEIMDNEELLTKYHNHMMSTLQLYNEIQEYVFNKTASHERANEQARHVLPISTHADFVIGMTVEALIHFENSRL